MSKKVIKSLAEGAIVGLGVGLLMFIIMLFAGWERYIESWPVVVGGFVFLAYVFADNFPGTNL